MKTVNREILAPVGAWDRLEAAVKSGADAVYFGASDFNARRNADNFGREEFLSAVAYCSERGVKSYITLNTLVKDTELKELYGTLALIAESGADAVIVQDLAVAKTVKECCPGLQLHASTQMAVHNLSGAKMLEEFGFSRIVPARELSIGEMKAICEGIKAETEVFVHGAHCMSASGMCYMSSALGARSGNRGLCAQPCRLNFKADGRQYALSLKDMCLIDRVRELDEAGVDSFKIEGRMKRPEYVAAAVSAYKAACNGEKYDTETLKSVFSRSGFTDGYASGRRDINMFGYRTKEDVVAASGVLNGLKNIYKDEYKRVKLGFELKVKENEKSVLKITDGKNTVEVTGQIPEKAVNRPLDREGAERNLLKLGGTYFTADKLDCDIGEGLMLSASALNALRREAVDKLCEIRRQSVPHKFVYPEDKFPIASKAGEAKTRLRFRNADMIPENIECEMLILPVDGLKEDTVNRYGKILCAELPALIYPADEERYLKKLEALKAMGVKKIFCNNIGAVAVCKRAGLIPVGGALMNIMNSKAAAVLRDMGVDDICVSFEMSFELMKKFKFGGTFGFYAYGHMPLMHFRCCPMQGKNGCGKCTGERTLTDRRGDAFTVLCENRRYSVLYNPIPLYTGDIKMPDADFALLYFTNESKEEAEEIIKCFNGRKSLPCKRTAGLYDKKLL